ncbi:hypothetical protein ACP275_04G114100 [Erythranthe tilingii]
METPQLNPAVDAQSIIRRRTSKPYFQIDATNLQPSISVCKGMYEDEKPMIRFKYKGKNKCIGVNQIPQLVLSMVKDRDSRVLGLMVPAHFTFSQIPAMEASALRSRVCVRRIINPPVAAAIANGLDQGNIPVRTVLAFHLGGENCEVSVFTIEKDCYRMKAATGDPLLGGVDFSNRLFNHFEAEFVSKHGESFCTDDRSLRRLRQACERAKIALSTTDKATVEIDSLYDGGADLCSSITRVGFEDLNADLFRKCGDLVKRCLMYAKIHKNLVNDVVLIGGSTKIPKVQKMLCNFFGRDLLCTNIDPHLAVKYGQKLYTDTQKVKKLVLLHSARLNLGIETNGGVMSVVVPKNTVLPIRKNIICSTSSDDQSSVLIQVFQGLRLMAKDNNLLAKFQLKGIGLGPRGAPKINLCFHVEADGVLNVSAEDKIFGLENEITITYNNGWVKRKGKTQLGKDVSRFRREDERARERVEARNELENYAYEMRRACVEDERIHSCDRSTIEKSVYNVLLWLENNGSAAPADVLANSLKDFKNYCTPFIPKGGRRRPKLYFDLNV